MKNRVSFGHYLKALRESRGWGKKDLAAALGFSAPYLYDVEEGRRSAFRLDKLEELSRALGLKPHEKARLMDLAGQQRGTYPPDIAEKLSAQDFIGAALRKTVELGWTDKEWQRLAQGQMTWEQPEEK